MERLAKQLRLYSGTLLLFTAVMLFIVATSCSDIMLPVSFPIKNDTFFEPPTYTVDWPILTLNPWADGISDYFPEIFIHRNSYDIDFSGKYRPYETKQSVAYDLRQLGFSKKDVPRIKCYWADSKKARKPIFEKQKDSGNQKEGTTNSTNEH